MRLVAWLALCLTTVAPASSASYHVIHSFAGGSDGAQPEASLIDIGSTLYGTTVGGGSSTACNSFDDGCGTVYKITPKGAETVLYVFQGGHNGDGGQPTASLINIGGTLYGTTLADLSTVFKITLQGEETALHDLNGGSDGEGSFASLLNVGGTLYGTTAQGGGTGCPVNVNGTIFASGCGTVFKITPTGVETVLHVFRAASDGAQPVAGLIDLGGTLYGTTQQGGAYGNGTVFKITP